MDKIEDFPRESRKPTTENKLTKRGQKRPADDDDDDDEEKVVKSVAVKKPKTVANKNTKSQKSTDSRLKSFSFHVEKDLLVLGCVSEVRDYEVVITLPDGLRSKLPITSICDAYTEQLQKLASEEPSIADEDSPPKLLSLHEIFHPGSVVRCCVTDVVQTKSKKIVTVSVNPQLVNRDVVKFQPGTAVSGVVSSCEDHGYVIDLGAKNVAAFLTKEDTKKFVSKNKESFPENVELFVGSYLTCVVKKQKKNSEKNRAINLTIDPDELDGICQDKIVLQSLLPGTVVNCSITSKDKTAVFVSSGDVYGVIFNSHLEQAPGNYQEGQELIATVLYVQSVTKTVVLSELKHLSNPLVYLDPFESVSMGSIIKEAKLLKADPKFGVFFKLPDSSLKGFVKKSQFSDKATEHIDKLKKGELHPCRVIGFDYLNRLVNLTMKESLLKLKFFTYQDLKPGQVIECTVKKLQRSGAIVKVMGRMNGVVPSLHLSDIPLLNPEKKFKVGKSLKCKVLVVSAEKSKLLLTHKKSLIKPKNLLPYDYEEVSKNSLLTGFVVLIKPQGLLVAFGGEVKGWVPKKELSYGIIENPEKEFYTGQVVDCMVKYSDPAEKKIVLSLKVSQAPPPQDPTVEADDDSVKPVKEDHKDVESPKKKAKTEEVPKPSLVILPSNRMFNWEDEKANVDNETDTRKSFKASQERVIKNTQESVNAQRLKLEKAALLKPNQSRTWLNLIAFEAEEGNLDGARQVCERALKAIPFREEQEKLNVHLCRLNLEHKYGTKETLKEYVDACLTYCDNSKVYKHLRDMHEAAGEFQEAIDVCEIVVKKYKAEPESWIGYFGALFRSNKADQARAALNDSFKRLDKKHIVEVTTRFALLESNHGQPAKAVTLFEGLVSGLPKRTDLWSVYVDMCVRLGMIDQARGVLERAVELQLPKKKVQFMLKKFVAFEEKHGSPRVVEELKKKLQDALKNDD